MNLLKETHLCTEQCKTCTIINSMEHCHTPLISSSSIRAIISSLIVAGFNARLNDHGEVLHNVLLNTRWDGTVPGSTSPDLWHTLQDRTTRAISCMSQRLNWWTHIPACRSTVSDTVKAPCYCLLWGMPWHFMPMRVMWIACVWDRWDCYCRS